MLRYDPCCHPWSSMAISSDTFATTHEDLSIQLSKEISRGRRRPRELLRSRSKAATPVRRKSELELFIDFLRVMRARSSTPDPTRWKPKGTT